jgi:hypothetical protein
MVRLGTFAELMSCLPSLSELSDARATAAAPKLLPRERQLLRSV